MFYLNVSANSYCRIQEEVQCHVYMCSGLDTQVLLLCLLLLVLKESSVCLIHKVFQL